MNGTTANFEARLGGLERMFEGFISVMEKTNSSLAENNTTALQIAQETNNKLIMQGKMINTILHVQEEQDVEIKALKDKFDTHMANEMINPAQEKMIKNEIFKRICEFISTDDIDWVLYSKAYFGNMYSFLRKDFYLMNPIACTRSKNYDDVMEGIMTWYPNESEIRSKADKRRNARKAAQNK